MSEGRNVLIVEDDADSREGLESLLRSRGHQTRSAGSIAEAWEVIGEDDHLHLVVLDLGLPDGDGMDMLARLMELPGRRAVLVLTGDRSLDRAVEAMRLGAYDYLLKPLQPEALQISIDRLTRYLEEQEETTALRRQLARRGTFQGMVGASPAMQHIYQLVERAAPSRIPVFIEGESGTGKELLAGAIHRVSGRRSRPFIAINCGAIPSNLVESELFGHEKGSFTGATARHVGVFEQAHGGTLFLDELPEMPHETQVKLLRVLETGTVRRVGGSRDIPVDVRIVSATNRDPEEAVRTGNLREDLYFRLHVFSVRMPPLRERRDDIPLLAEHFVESIAQSEGGTPVRLTDEARQALLAHDWPGNVRELRNVLSRAWLLSNGEPIAPGHLGLVWRPAAPGQGRPVPRGSGAWEPGRDGPVAVHEGNGLDALAPRSSSAGGVFVPLGSTLEDAERLVVEAYLAHYGGHRQETARALGVTPKTLYNKIKAWGLVPGSSRARG